MAQNTTIEWAHHTFNPWVGCAKVSAGCKNCYAEHLMDHRHGRVQWGVNGTRSRTAPGNWKQPLLWNKKRHHCETCGHWQEWSGPCRGKKKGLLAINGVTLNIPVEKYCGAPTTFVERPRVFCSSLADVCEKRPELVPWREDLKALIRATPNLHWLILTKRPENLVEMFGGEQWPNVYFGTSVEDQAAANERIPHLLKAAHLCKYTFLSCEPLLGPVDLLGVKFAQHGEHFVDVLRGGYWCKAPYLMGARSAAPGEGRGGFVNHSDLQTQGMVNWVIAGGESGQHARPMHPDWARTLRDQCAAAGVPFLFKQWGEFSFLTDTEGRQHSPFGGQMGKRVGKKAAGRLLDGVEHNGFPSSDQRPS